MMSSPNTATRSRETAEANVSSAKDFFLPSFAPEREERTSNIPAPPSVVDSAFVVGHEEEVAELFGSMVGDPYFFSSVSEAFSVQYVLAYRR